MAIITFATSKGGAGKTTMAAGVGVELALRGGRVAIVAARPSSTGSRRPPPAPTMSSSISKGRRRSSSSRR